MRIIKNLIGAILIAVFFVIINISLIFASKTGPYIVEYEETPSTGTVFNDYLNTKNNIIGGVFCVKNTGSLNLRKVSFSSNTAYNVGGAIGNSGDTIIKSYVSFSSNTATSGGAIYNVNNGNLTTFGDVIFEYNKAKKRNKKDDAKGGAIFNDGDILISKDELFGYGSTFAYNIAESSGGAIYNSGKLIINSSEFKDNFAPFGGAIYNDAYTEIGDKSNFLYNKAIDVEIKEDNLSNKFLVLNIEGSGGAIYNKYNNMGRLVINSNVSFSSNTACYGGAIDNCGVAIIDSNVQFSSNIASIGGAIRNLNVIDEYGRQYGGQLEIGANVVFIENMALKLWEKKYEDGEIVDDKFNILGGAIYNGKNSSIEMDSNVKFIKNKSDDFGGAIYNEGKALINSRVKFNSNTAFSGGAIYNNGNFSTGYGASFLYNVAESSGGAIYNSTGTVTIGVRTEFIQNRAIELEDDLLLKKGYGGAIYNGIRKGTGTIIIDSDVVFYANTAFSGGAIQNYGNMIINSDNFFYSNIACSGGAITNIGNLQISSNVVFMGNENFDLVEKIIVNKKTETVKINSNGGAIYNDGSVSIASNANFKENTSDFGGAIYNGNGKITIASGANFSSNNSLYGGTIYNTTGTIAIGSNASFNGNSSSFSGGAIYNIIGNITIDLNANFKENSSRLGGVIYNTTGTITIGKDTNFIKNEASYSGGVIYNSIGKGTVRISSNVLFKNNKAVAIGTGDILGEMGGGVIYNSTGIITIGDKTSFIENESGNLGGVIYNCLGGKITIGSDVFFKDNYSKSGGVIYNTTGTISIGSNASFNGNYSYGYDYKYGGGVIQNNGGSIVVGSAASFTGNEAANFGGVICNNRGLISIGEKSLFKENKAINSGGAIYNEGTILIENDVLFSCNSSWGSDDKYGGGAIQNNGGKVTIYSNANFIENESSMFGGAIYNVTEKGTTSDKGITIGENALLKNNKTMRSGGAIYNSGKFIINSGVIFESNEANYHGGTLYNDYDGEFTIRDGAKFFNNKAKGIGGAIYNNGILNLIANGVNIEFIGNKQYVGTEKEESNAIYNNGTIKLYANGANIIFNDKITGSGELYINEKKMYSRGKIILNTDMSGYKGEVCFYNGTIELGKNGTLFNNYISNMDIENATLNMANGNVANIQFNEVTIGAKLHLTLDADLKNKTMDMLCFQQNIKGAGKINVKEINIIDDSNEITRVDFTNINNNNRVITVNKASSFLYKYNVRLDYGKLLSDVDGYYYTFSKAGINYKSAVPAIASSIGGYASQSEIIKQTFFNTDIITSNSDYFSNKNNDNFKSSKLYASVGDSIFEFDDDSSIERNLWLRPFGLQEKIDLDEVSIDNILYGTLAGIDFPIGQDKQVSFYLGYTGSNQKFDEVKVTQNGYIIGMTGMLINENWYLGATINGIFNIASVENDDEDSDFDMNMFSLGAKAGYNFDINEKWILEPNITLMYGIVNSDSYKTSRGIIDSQSINNILLEPQLKIKFLLNEEWLPYGLLGYAANLSGKTTIKSNGQESEMDSIDGYLEYGLGVNRTLDDVWSYYVQVTGRSGGRNGFAGNFGIKYKF